MSPRTISVYGRKVRVPLAAGSVARFNFADLCEEVSYPHVGDDLFDIRLGTRSRGLHFPCIIVLDNLHRRCSNTLPEKQE